MTPGRKVLIVELSLVDSYLLSTTTRRSVVDLMPMIGARYYTHLDTTQLQCDVLESELAKEMENGRLCRLLVKLATINERPESVLIYALSPLLSFLYATTNFHLNSERSFVLLVGEIPLKKLVFEMTIEHISQF